MTATPRRLTLALAVLLAAGAVVAGSREDVRADDAVRVVRQIQSIPESSIPDRCSTMPRRSSSSPTPSRPASCWAAAAASA